MNIDFWLGKVVAEALPGVVIMILVAIATGVAIILDKRQAAIERKERREKRKRWKVAVNE